MEELRRDRRIIPFVLKGELTGRQIGSGPYGSVEEIEVNGLLHVGKRIHKRLITASGATIEDIARKYSQECKVMSGLRHPNITIFLGLCFVPDCHFPLLVMEKLDGSLDDLLETISDIPLALKRSLLEDIARGLFYLHSYSPQIIHMDLTAKNVLLTTSMEAKISDFGNSYVVNAQPDFRATSRYTLAYISPEAINEASHFSPSLDVFSFGQLILFTLNQEFSEDIPEAEYTDPTTNPNKPVRHSEVERRAKYFDQLDDKIIKGQHHPLAQLSKDCLNNNPWQRPSAEQLLSALEDMEEEVEGPYGEFTKLDAIRQVAAMKSLLERDIEVREKAKKLAVMGEKVRQLQKKLKQSEQVHKTTADERLEAELHKDIEIEVKEAQILELRQTITDLKEKLEQKESDLLYQNALLRQKDSDMLRKDEEVCTKEDKIQEKNETLWLKDAELNHKDEEIYRREIRIILKNAELKYKDSLLQGRDRLLHQKISELKEKHSVRVGMDKKLQQLQKKLKEKVAELDKRSNREEDFQQLNVFLQQKSKELRQREKELQLKDEELHLKDAIIKKKNEELCTTEEQLCQLQAQLEKLKKESQQRDISLHEAQDEDSQLTKTLRQKEAELRMKEDELQEKTSQLQEAHAELKRRDKQLLQKSEELKLKKELQLKDEELHLKNTIIKKKNEELCTTEEQLCQLQAQIEQLKKESQQRDVRLHEAEDEDSKLTKMLRQKEAELRIKGNELQAKTSQLQEVHVELERRDKQLLQKCEELKLKDRDLKQKCSELNCKDEELCKKCEELKLKDKEVEQKCVELTSKDGELYQKTLELQLKVEKLTLKEGECEGKNQEMNEVVAVYKDKVDQAANELKEKAADLKKAIEKLKLKDTEIEQKSTLISEKDNELHHMEEVIQRLEAQVRLLSVQIHQRDEELKRKESEIATIQAQMQKDTEVHQKETEMKDTELGIIMEHIYQLQETTGELRSDLDRRNSDVGRLQDELTRMRERPQILAATGQMNDTQLLPSELPLKVELRNGKDMPHGMRYHPQAVVLHGKIYIGGGKSEFHERNTQVMTYDPRLEVWSVLPCYHYELFAMTSIEEQLVLVGGEDARSRKKTNVLGVWDERLHYWTHPFPPMLTACSSPTVVNYKEKWLIVAGGTGDGGDLFIVEVMDISDDHWYSAPPLPVPASKMSATIVDDNTMVVLGGASGYYFFKKVFKVNLDELITQAIAQQPTVSNRRLHRPVPAQTPWQKLPDTPFTQSAAVTFRGSLLAVGGLGGATIHYYHPDSRSWVKAGDLPSGERLQCACTVLPNGELFLAGGSNTEDCVEILTLL